jgi:hypothetical protein
MESRMAEKEVGGLDAATDDISICLPGGESKDLLKIASREECSSINGKSAEQTLQEQQTVI